MRSVAHQATRSFLRIGVFLLCATGLSIGLSTSALAKPQPPTESSRKTPTRKSKPANVKSALNRKGVSAVGQSKKIGIGLYLGEPVGITGKLWLDERIAISFLLGRSDPQPGAIAMAEILYHVRNLAPSLSSVELGFYGGAGGGLGLWRPSNLHDHSIPWPHSHRHERSDLLAMVRGVIGVAVWLRNAPLEIFGEIGPALELTPDSGDIQMTGALGARFYF